MPIDFGRTAKDYAKHRAGFPPALFDRLQTFRVGLPGHRVLDLGTGTGTVARNFALKGCRVTGLDPSTALMEQAAQLDAEAGVTVAYREGRAEATGLPDASFDVVAAGQCWHWFKRDAAAREAMRLLVAGGALVIAHFDWLPLGDNVAAATETLIREFNPDWKFYGGTGVYPRWPADASLAGFTGIETFSFDVDVPYSHQDWRGRIRASAGVAASLPAERVAQFDAALTEMLRQRFPEDPVITPHRVWALVARKPGHGIGPALG